MLLPERGGNTPKLIHFLKYTLYGSREHFGWGLGGCEWGIRARGLGRRGGGKNAGGRPSPVRPVVG